MLNLPADVNDFMIKLVSETRSPAYLTIQKDGILSDFGGSLTVYGIHGLQKDQRAADQILFLEGMLPLESSPMFLPYVKTDSGLYADVYLMRKDEGTSVLFLDATFDARKRKAIQQKANDLSLFVVEQRKEGDDF